MTSADSSRKRKWAIARRVAGVVFALLVLTMVVRNLSHVDWSAAFASVGRYDYRTLVPAAALVCLSYLLHASFDLLGRAYAGHKLSSRRVLLIAFVSYALNLNLGALIGGLGVRYRLYARAGLDVPQIANVYSIGIVSNWIGYFILAGTVLATRLVVLPEKWAPHPALLQALGALLLIISAGYLVACYRAPWRSWTVRGHTIRLPSLRFALAQCAISIVNWVVIAAIVNILLPPEIRLPAVLAVMLTASVAGAITHIPAGLGVLEAVFLVLLGDRLAHPVLIGGLITYRALYYLAPLGIAVITYFWMEAKQRRSRHATITP